MKLKNPVLIHESPLMSKGIEVVIGRRFSCDVTSYSNATEGLKHLKSKACDLLICSYLSPNLGALELINRCKLYSPQTKILVIAVEVNLLAVERCFQNGANAYVTSHICSSELTKGLEKVMQGELYTENCVTHDLAMSKIQGTNPVLAKLSSKEIDILVKVARDKPVSAVAKELFLAEKTVANYVSIIKKKLNVKTNAGLLEIAVKEGFIDLVNKNAA